MAYDPAKERTKNLLEAQLAQEKTRLAELEEILRQTEVDLKQAKHNIAYFQGLIDFISKDDDDTGSATEEASVGIYSQNQAQQNVKNSAANESWHGNYLALAPAFENTSLGNDGDEDDEEQTNRELAESELNPIDFLRSQYKGKTMPEVVRLVLGTYRKPMRAVEIAHAAYDAPSSEAFSRARNSIGAELRMGAGKKGWIKAGRGRYVLDSVAPQQASEIHDAQLKAELTLTNNGRRLDS
jgi:hypothetical protein